jgi:uncharacterized membrane protein YebE (DUF533 family)
MRILIMTMILFLAPAVNAQELFIFPNEDQSQDQQDMDEFQCQKSATQRTGFDPMALPTTSSPAPKQKGGVGQGAVKGALLGTAVGAVTGNTKKGLKAGAVGGGVMGGMKRADSNSKKQDWANQQSQDYLRNRDNWNRAFTACIESRGYTVR